LKELGILRGEAVPEIVRQCDEAATILAMLDRCAEREVELSS
jgi:hypothetical protein